MSWYSKAAKKVTSAVGTAVKSAMNVSVGMATVGTVKPFKSDPIASKLGDVAKVVSRTGVAVGAAVAAPMLAAGGAAAGAAVTKFTPQAMQAIDTAVSGGGNAPLAVTPFADAALAGLSNQPASAAGATATGGGKGTQTLFLIGGGVLLLILIGLAVRGSMK